MARITRGERVGRLGRLAVGCSAAVFDPTGDRILLVRRADSTTTDPGLLNTHERCPHSDKPRLVGQLDKVTQ